MSARAGRSACLSGVALLLAGCGPATSGEVVLLDGARTTRVPVRSAYAEYVELPPARTELRVTLADYAVSCERWIPPRDGGHAITVVIVTPPSEPPKVGSYAWTGVPAEGAPGRAYALPKVLEGERSWLVQPGGAVRLTAVHLEPRGTIAGILGFEFPGDPDHPATRINGNFEAKMCRFSKPER